ncbi:MAG TPA: hypothetical protein VMW24_22185 [Sedimentisphaerales bacterium]|nr:hypothetical protein [Sedimentisphaerales bacterium]
MNKTRCLTILLAVILVCSLNMTTVHGQTKNTWISKLIQDQDVLPLQLLERSLQLPLLGHLH